MRQTQPHHRLCAGQAVDSEIFEQILVEGILAFADRDRAELYSRHKPFERAESFRGGFRQCPLHDRIADERPQDLLLRKQS